MAHPVPLWNLHRKPRSAPGCVMKGVMMPHGAYPPHVAYMVQPAGTVPWPGHYDSTTHLQGNS